GAGLLEGAGERSVVIAHDHDTAPILDGYADATALDRDPGFIAEQVPHALPVIRLTGVEGEQRVRIRPRLVRVPIAGERARRRDRMLEERARSRWVARTVTLGSARSRGGALRRGSDQQRALDHVERRPAARCGLRGGAKRGDLGANRGDLVVGRDL